MALSNDQRLRAEIDAHLLVSLGLHLNEHEVTTPLRIGLPAQELRRDRLSVQVPAAELPIWLDSVVVEARHDAALGLVLGRPWVRREVRAHLPSSYAPIHLTSLLRAD